MRLSVAIMALVATFLGLALVLQPARVEHAPSTTQHSSPTTHHSPLTTHHSPLPALIDGRVQEAMRAWQVPGAAVAIVRDDRVIYLRGFGVRELGKEAAVTPDTLFPIASCTKAFTTTALALLVDAGTLNWDDPVRKHVPYFGLADPLANSQVTLRDLVSHRTGVGSHDFLWYHAPWSREEIIRKIGLVKPSHPFRSAFMYQSTMFTTAGQAVELTSGSSWDAFVRHRLFVPLGMKSAGFTTTAALEAPDHASAHRRGPGGEVRSIPWYAIPRPDPAGSIHASARDLAQWLRFQLGDGSFAGQRLVSRANLAETHSPQTIIRLEGLVRDLNPDTTQMCYGMGWVIQDHRGQLLVSHAGAVDGFRAHITLVPRHRLGLVVLNNLDRTQMNLALSNTLVDLLLDLPARDWHALVAGQLRQREAVALEQARASEARRHRGTKPSRTLDAYAGTYSEPAYGSARIVLDNGKLVWHWGTFSAPLEHYHYDTFTMLNEVLGFPRVVFSLRGDGEVESLYVPQPLEVEFRKGERGASAPR